MRVLVTGGAGFIGSHLADAALQQGHQVIVLDNLAGGSSSNVPRDADFVLSDIADPETVEIIAKVRPDAILHAAAQASVPRSMHDPVQDRAVNLIGTEHVILGAKRSGNCRVIFLSTGGGIYGETTTPATEESLPRPRSFYSLHKYAAEKYLEYAGIPYAIARLANVYGPRQQSHLEGGVVAVFAERLKNALPVAIHGTGEQTRDFVHVHDVARAVLTMLDTHLDGTWNVSTGHAISINDLLAMMQEVIAPAVDVRHEPRRSGDVLHSCLSPARIARDLGWSPTITVQEGIAGLALPG